MTAALTHEGSTDSAWDFASVFTALNTPPASRVTRQPLNLKPVELSTPDLKRTRSQDDDETPKATPNPDEDTNLGDFSHILSYLGYSVQVKAPTVLSVPDLEQPLHCAPELNQPIQIQVSGAVEDDLENRNPDVIKTAIKKAEKGRRAVLDDYLGSSPETSGAVSIKQKSLKTKTTSPWLEIGLSPSSLLPRKFVSSRKQASMNIAAENKIKLILELHKRFPEDIDSLANVNRLSLDIDPNGIHCFVDISNILIGFHDTLKRHRQINVHTRIPRQTLSFHNLSILLERGRLTAKRFLAGSDDIDCTQEARLLGYTTHILQRVDKPDYSFAPGTRKGKRSGLTSSDTDSGTSGRTKRAEQAVDEVLHLGMLQSLLDAEKPSTIVLASGDAAKAEFSDGFLKQVERALVKGWKVEVMAFKATTGSAYRDTKWASKWGDSFRLIPLDEYAELLHIPYEGSTF